MDIVVIQVCRTILVPAVIQVTQVHLVIQDIPASVVILVIVVYLATVVTQDIVVSLGIQGIHLLVDIVDTQVYLDIQDIVVIQVTAV